MTRRGRGYGNVFLMWKPVRDFTYGQLDESTVPNVVRVADSAYGKDCFPEQPYEPLRS